MTGIAQQDYNTITTRSQHDHNGGDLPYFQENIHGGIKIAPRNDSRDQLLSEVG